MMTDDDDTRCAMTGSGDGTVYDDDRLTVVDSCSVDRSGLRVSQVTSQISTSHVVGDRYDDGQVDRTR